MLGRKEVASFLKDQVQEVQEARDALQISVEVCNMWFGIVKGLTKEGRGDGDICLMIGHRQCVAPPGL